MDELGTKWQQLEGCHWAAASDSDRERAWRRLCRTDTVLCFDLDLQSDFGFVPRSRQGQSTPTVCQLHAEWLRAGHRRTDQDRVWRELAPTEIDTMPLAQLLNSEPPNGHGQRASASRSPISSVAALAPEPSPSVDIEQLVEELPLPHPSSLDPRDAPPYQQPVLLTSFSYGPQRQLILDERRDDSLRVLRHPPATLPHDLNQGFESATWRDDLVDEGLDSLLDSLLEARATVPEPDRSAFDARLSATRLITWRGMLTRILASVYETPNSDGWEMNAMYLDNTLFLEDRKSAKAGRSSDEKSRQTYYGYAFESWATAEPGVRDPDPSPDDVNTNVQWCAVVKATLGDIRMVLGGEVDCLVGHKPGEPIVPDSFVELKTSIELATDKDRRKFERFKALKFYLQSYLLGTRLIRVGFRTREGMLTSTHDFDTLTLPAFLSQRAHPEPRPWSTTACLSTAILILRFLIDRVGTHPATADWNTTFRDRAAAAEGDFDTSGWAHWPVFRVRFDPPVRDQHAKVRPPRVVILGPVSVSELEAAVERTSARPAGPRAGFLPSRWVESRWHSIAAAGR